jgi:hypothetical protein
MKAQRCLSIFEENKSISLSIYIYIALIGIEKNLLRFVYIQKDVNEEYLHYNY